MDVKIIEKTISEEYGIPDIMTRTRKSNVVEARAVLFWILKNKMGMSYPTIGKMYKFNHVTIMHNVKRVDNQITCDKNFYKKFKNIVEKFS